MKTNWRGSAYDKGPEDAYMREQLSISVGELVYGLGERFSAFVKKRSERGHLERGWGDFHRTVLQEHSVLPFQ